MSQSLPPTITELWQTKMSPNTAKCLRDKITSWMRTIALQCIQSGHKNNPFITEGRLCNTSAKFYQLIFISPPSKKMPKSLPHSLMSTGSATHPLLLELLSYFSPLYSLCNSHTRLFTLLQICQQNSHLKVGALYPLWLQSLLHDIHLAYSFSPSSSFSFFSFFLVLFIYLPFYHILIYNT